MATRFCRVPKPGLFKAPAGQFQNVAFPGLKNN